jgi:amino acid transporter
MGTRAVAAAPARGGGTHGHAVPSIVIGILTFALLVLNVGNQRAFFVLTSVAIIMFYLAYMCVTVPLLIARVRGNWPAPTHGPYFSLGRWGLPVNMLAVIFQVIVLINLFWPRALLRYSPASRPSCHWASGEAEIAWLEVP